MTGIDELIRKGEIIPDYESKILQEEREKKTEYFLQYSFNHSKVLVSSEINEKVESNKAFEIMINTALSEIRDVLDEEFHGKIGYMIEIYVFQDYDDPSWRTNVIRIKVPINNPKYVLRLWDKVSDRVWDKVLSIKENAEEIRKIESNTRISFDILE